MTTSQSNEYTRLHITPLDADLLKIIVPASAASYARNVSYHTIETFPEKRYGFVDLPATDAEKLRTKLNGAVLKGSKMRIEKARPEKTMESPEVSSKKDNKKSEVKSKDKEASKKRKRDDDVADGVELSNRKVKRGWTETTDETIKRSKKERSEKTSKFKSKDKDGVEDKKLKKKDKKRTKTKYTDGSECLLKTQIPANKDLSDKDKAEKKKKKKGNEREVTVHEFEKTTRFPTFLKETGSKIARTEAEYVEGKGWVDEDGNVVEAVVEKKPKKAKKEKKAKRKVKTPTPEPESDSETSSSGTSSDDDSDTPAQPFAAAVPDTKVDVADDDDSDTSSEGSSDEEVDTETVQPKTPAGKEDTARPESSSSSRSLKIKIPPPDTPSNGKVHPLEALYKRRQASGSNAQEASEKEAEPFSFFGGGDGDEDAEDETNGQDEAPVMPMTPFTKQDFEWRNVRSAAPTPDTAHPARMQNFWASENDQDEEIEDAEAEVEDEEEEEEEAQAPAGDRAVSDFQSWFWENRRELNQSWMKRRKTVAKEKRNRENKARTSRAV